MTDEAAAAPESLWGRGRALSLGWPEPRGSIGIARRLELLDRLRPLHGATVLDVGCGNGSYTERLVDRYARVTGVEIEPGRLDEFRSRIAERDWASRVTLRLESAEHLSDADATYDAVVCIETLEHVVDDEAAAREIFRVLRPGGAFYVTVPNRGFPFETHSFMVGGRERRSKWYPFVPWIRPLHRRISTARNYRPADLRRLLRPIGFVEVGTTFMMPPLERWGPGRHLRGPVLALERTPLRHLGVSVVAVFEKRA
ncbi:MAG: class I SAM-dependent methyltransferase [Actinobacteria bacterium]|nr:class I SAM-dependent methyltransferase [Actinomycetota bacterium]